MMRWLEWATIDLQHGLGGVEVHARHLAHEFGRRGVEVRLSNSREDLQQTWDVVHTHGSSVPSLPLRTGDPRPLRLHTLHGTTFGRMAACGEWLWPGGYRAALREWVGVMQADVVFGVQPDMWLLSWARARGKRTAVCLNGWDSPSDAVDRLPEALEEALRHRDGFWLFLGRGDRAQKGIDTLESFLQREPQVDLVAAPGDGFRSDRVVRTGRLGTSQVQHLCRRAAGLIVPSRYEGLPLVVLEALAQGTRVVSGRAGGMAHLESQLQPEGLVVVRPGDVDALQAGWTVASAWDDSPESRERRAAHNRRILPSWSDVASSILDVVLECRPALRAALHPAIPGGAL